MTISFGIVDRPTEVSAIQPPAPKKRGWLPLLTVLFLISYALMTMLIVEQGRTIESQRSLIHELFRDSVELSAAKLKAQQAQAAQSKSDLTQNPSTQIPLSQVPTQVPSSQAPAKQAPSTQAGAQNRVQTQGVKPKTQFQMPSRPAADLADSRRALVTI